jgi:hypothetical protein
VVRFWQISNLDQPTFAREDFGGRATAQSLGGRALMAYFIARGILHGAKEDDYEDLHGIGTGRSHGRNGAQERKTLSTAREAFPFEAL